MSCEQMEPKVLACCSKLHYSEVTCASWHLKSLATQLFVWQLFRLKAKKTSKLLITGPLWVVRGNVESVSMQEEQGLISLIVGKLKMPNANYLTTTAPSEPDLLTCHNYCSIWARLVDVSQLLLHLSPTCWRVTTTAPSEADLLTCHNYCSIWARLVDVSQLLLHLSPTCWRVTTTAPSEPDLLTCHNYCSIWARLVDVSQLLLHLSPTCWRVTTADTDLHQCVTARSRDF